MAEIKQNNSSARIISQAESAIKEIKSGIEYANTNVNAFNAGLRNHIRKELEQKANIQSFFDIAKVLEVPIEKKDYSKRHVAVERRIVPIAHVVDFLNGGSDGQYPEGLMKIQNRQGYCLLLGIEES